MVFMEQGRDQIKSCSFVPLYKLTSNRVFSWLLFISTYVY